MGDTSFLPSWGVVALMLLVLTAGTMALRRRFPLGDQEKHGLAGR